MTKLNSRLLAVAAAVLLTAPSAAATGEVRHVAGDKLWEQGCFVIQAPNIVVWHDHRFKSGGGWLVRQGYIACVSKVDRSGPRPWYQVRIVKSTRKGSMYLPGWIDSGSLMTHGVTVAN